MKQDSEFPGFQKNPYYEDLEENVKKGLAEKEQFDTYKYESNAIPSKKVLAEYKVEIESNNISYITMDAFHHMIVLTKDSKLYIDNVLYKEGVKKIIEFTKTNLIFILEDNEVEYYSNKKGILKECKKYDKVLYTDHFIAMLWNKNLYVYYKIIIADNCTLIEDETFDTSFSNVEDIALKEVEDIIYLEMKTGNSWISSAFIVGKLS